MHLPENLGIICNAIFVDIILGDANIVHVGESRYSFLYFLFFRDFVLSSCNFCFAANASRLLSVKKFVQ